MATTEVTELFRNVANPSDTVGTVHHIQGRGSTSRRGDTYKLCSFTNVCASNDKLFFAHHDQGQVAKWKEEWNEKCWKVAHWLQPPICNCFHPGFLPDFLTPDQLALDRTLTHQSEFTHTWGVHKWVWEHHIAHWAQKLIIWQSTYQHAPFDNLPPIDSILFHDSDPPLSDHETVIFDAVLSALQPPRTHPIAQMRGAEREKWTVWAQTLRDKKSAAESTLAAQLSSGQAPTLDPSHLTCFERLSFSPFYGMFSTHPDDTANFRNAVYAHFGLPLATRCPPRRAVLLYRNNRVIVNRDELRAMLKKEYDLEVEYVTIDEKSTSEEQVTLFATTGLLLSSHSSQMINVLFSPPGSAMVEIAPEFYNADFSEYAHGMGIFFQYALGQTRRTHTALATPNRCNMHSFDCCCLSLPHLYLSPGGSVPDGTAQPLQAECVSHLSSCEGASHCILAERHLCQNKEYPNKNLNFVANLTAVSIAVKNSLAHLNWLCTGRW